MEEAEKFRLAFALPHACLRKAGASLGLRAFEEASRHLNRGEQLASELVDPRLWGSIQSVKALTLLAQGDFDKAAVITHRPPEDVGGSALAEVRATHALVLACAGESRVAEAEARAAQELSRAIEPTLLSKFAMAISSSQKTNTGALPILNDAIEHAVRADAVDCFVASYRGYPEILKRIDHAQVGLLTPIMRQAQDIDLAKSVGLVIPEAPAGGHRPRPKLSAREDEVYELMSEGLTNRQIAERLFLGESTVKVHVRHIFEKLGVRTELPLLHFGGRSSLKGRGYGGEPRSLMLLSLKVEISASSCAVLLCSTGQDCFKCGNHGCVELAFNRLRKPQPSDAARHRITIRAV